MTSVRHWLNLERGQDPLKTASAAWVLLPYFPSPFLTTLRCLLLVLQPWRGRSWGHQGLGNK